MDKDLRDRMVEAAQVVADEAKTRSGAWSHRIPAATSVFNDSTGIGVVVDNVAAPSASPNEYGDRHPLFGNRGYWYATPLRPFLAEAVDAKSDEAADIIGNVINDWTKGWDDDAS